MHAADIGFLILRLNIAAVFLLAAAVHSSPKGWHGLIVWTPASCYAARRSRVLGR
jgi:hypothetical protein